jgi:hypothetical protein
MPPLEYHATEQPPAVLNAHATRIQELVTEGITDPIEVQKHLLAWRRQQNIARSKRWHQKHPRAARHQNEPVAAPSTHTEQAPTPAKPPTLIVRSWKRAQLSPAHRRAYNEHRRLMRQEWRLKRRRKEWRTSHKGIPFAPRHRMAWQPHEDTLLRTYFGVWTDRAVANLLGRTTQAINERADEIKLGRRANSVTAAEVARALGVAPERIITHIRRGHFTASFRHRVWHINIISLLRYVQTHPWMFDVAKANPDHMVGNAVREAARDDPWLTIPQMIARYPYDKHTYEDWIRAGQLPAERRIGKGGLGVVYVVRESCAEAFFKAHDQRLDAVRQERANRLRQFKREMQHQDTDLARATPKPPGKERLAIGDVVIVPDGTIINGVRTTGLTGTITRLYVGLVKRRGKSYQRLSEAERSTIPEGGWVWRAELAAQRMRRDRRGDGAATLLRTVLLQDCLPANAHAVPPKEAH